MVEPLIMTRSEARETAAVLREQFNEPTAKAVRFDNLPGSRYAVEITNDDGTYRLYAYEDAYGPR